MEEPAVGLWIGQCFEVESLNHSDASSIEYSVTEYDEEENALIFEELDFEKCPEERETFKISCEEWDSEEKKVAPPFFLTTGGIVERSAAQTAEQ